MENVRPKPKWIEKPTVEQIHDKYWRLFDSNAKWNAQNIRSDRFFQCLIYGNGAGVGAWLGYGNGVDDGSKTTNAVARIICSNLKWVLALAIVVEMEILFRININKISNANGVLFR